MDRRTLLLAAIPVGLLTAFFGLYGLNRALTVDQIGHNVLVAGVPVSGLTVDEARSDLTTHGDLLSGTQIPVEAAGEIGEVSPLSLGFEPDPVAAAEAAFAVGRDGGFFADLGSWLGRLGEPVDVGLPVEVDEVVFEAGMAFLDEHLVGDPAFPGDVEIVDGTAVARYPREGTGIDREVARPLLLEAYLQTSRRPVALPTVRQEPPIDDAAVDAAVAEANLLLAAPVTLTTGDPDRKLVYTVPDLVNAFRIRITENSPATMEIDLDEDALRAKVDPLLETLARPPVDAELVLDRDNLTATVQPGRNGTKVDTVALEEAVLAGYRAPDRSAPLPLEEGAEPDITTEYLESLNINHMVSRFTTYHACCENRVTNIHIIADAANGTIVPPGETFDLNAIAGRRTEEKGYLPAGGIIGGEIDPEIIGGGISQFTTTLYAAMFWGGYEDVEHKPHSYYFSRYPMGIEATLDFDSVPLIWRNNDDDGAYVVAHYTDTSITVEIWGDNDGRALAGHQEGGDTNVWVLLEGGPDAKQVKGDIGEPYAFVEPGEDLVPNPELEPGTKEQVESGITGFTVDVTRTITHRGETTTETWTWRYLAKPVKYEVHPCDIPDGPPCPTTTTSTTATTTTTPTTTEPSG